MARADSKKLILDYLSRHESAGGGELRERLGITRQALHFHLRSLIEAGHVLKSGSTRAARYGLPSRAPRPAVLSRVLALSRLDEAETYDRLAIDLNLRRQLQPNVEALLHYAFTEMLNNAIEHSEAERCAIKVRLAAGAVSFTVRDRGIGVFSSIASKLDLADEQTAMVELLKGKTTTRAATHSGEGIFFTARVADRLVLRSHRIQVEWNSLRDDTFVSRRRFIQGTEVRFLVQRTTRRRVEDVFARFAPEEYDFRFQRTKLHVKLLRRDYVSRSEAKRLLANLERFREVVLDFKDVESIGQGFADEVFRVFGGRHPGTTISAQNANPTVEAMLRHAGMRPGRSVTG